MVIIFSGKLQSVFRTVFQGNSRYTNYPLMNLSSWILLLTISRQQYTFTIKSGKTSTSLLKRIIIRQSLRFPGGILPFYNLLESEYDEMMKRTDFSWTQLKNGEETVITFSMNRTINGSYIWKISAMSFMAAVIHDFRGFSVALQPLVKAGCRQPFGAETLMRFSSGQFGTISPAEFIPILEESGLIIPAGRWIIREALQACKKIRETIPDFQVKHNISRYRLKSLCDTGYLCWTWKAKLPPEHWRW